LPLYAIHSQLFQFSSVLDVVNRFFVEAYYLSLKRVLNLFP
jgi:hypothetical protein